MASKIRWADTLDDDEEREIPVGSVTGPDAKGVKTVVEYKKNEKGEIVKVTTRIKTSNIEKRVYKVGALRMLHDAAAPGAACLPCIVAVPAHAACICTCQRVMCSLHTIDVLHRRPLHIGHTSVLTPCRHTAASHRLLMSMQQSQLERRKWERFGNALKESDNDSVTVRAVEDIPFERVRLQKSTQEEKKTAVDVATALAMGDKSAVGTR
jgi:Eukaryotic translation initiation factor 3 subunit G